MDRNTSGRGPRRTPAAREGRKRKSFAPRPEEATALLVEDSVLISRLVAKSISSLPGYSVTVASSMAEAAAVLSREGSALTAAVVDLELPDATEGEVVDLAIGSGVPTIVLTGTYDEQIRQRVLQKQVVDYFVKGGRSLVALNDSLHRLRVNPKVKILVVDDSSAFRVLTSQLLHTHRFDVLEAADGAEALEVYDANPEVTLVITDFEMPRMNGIELVTELRDRKGRDDLAIIGVSALGNRALPAQYLKHGADDFLTKPFEKEEFYCRVYRSVQNVEQIQGIKRAAFTDQLTGLSNRLHFFSTVPERYERAVADGTPFSVAMVDIDFFKNVNDTYGHAAGDAALQHLSKLLDSSLPDADALARFGGEEFCIVTFDHDGGEVATTFERLRSAVEASQVEFEGQTIRFTLSIGVSVEPNETLDKMINRADEFLYEAKESGRNQVCIEPKGSER